jgi:hypothetical protein
VLLDWAHDPLEGDEFKLADLIREERHGYALRAGIAVSFITQRASLWHALRLLGVTWQLRRSQRHCSLA